MYGVDHCIEGLLRGIEETAPEFATLVQDSREELRQLNLKNAPFAEYMDLYRKVVNAYFP
jgi:hypothetical protein